MKRLQTLLLLFVVINIVAYSQPSDDIIYKKYSKCILKGKVEKARKFIDKGYNVDARNKDGKTPLLFSLQKHNVTFIDLFLNSGADIKLVDNYGNGCLHYAIENQVKESTIENFVEEGLDVNLPNKDLYTPYHFSVLFRCPDMTNYLIDNGANIKLITGNSENSLHLACESKCPEMVDYLMDKGLDINLVDVEGCTPLITALKNKQSHSAQQLIKVGAEINTVDHEANNPIFYTIRNSDTATFNMLIQHNVQLKDEELNNKIINLAAIKENEYITEVLLRNNVKNPMNCDEHDQCLKTAFIYYVQAEIAEGEEQVTLLKNSLNIYELAKDKYKSELNKIRAKNTAIFCTTVCLAAAGGAAGGGYGSPSYYTPTYYNYGGYDYEMDRTTYLKKQIKKCKNAITNIESKIASYEAVNNVAL